MNPMIRLRIMLTGVLVAIYLMVLAAQAYAQTGSTRGLMQGEQSTYFSFNNATLSSEARQQLDAAISDIQTRGDVKGARVVGFADRIGTPSTNERLSRERAENVKDYLIAKGIVNATVADMRWFGDSSPATNCHDNLNKSALIACLHNDRRVDVEIDYRTQMAKAQ